MSGTRDPKKQSWADIEDREGRVRTSQRATGLKFTRTK